MSNFTHSPLLSLRSPVVVPNTTRASQYTEVDISEYFDESVGEHDFLPSVPASPLKALFSTTVTSNNIPPRAAARSASPSKSGFLTQKRPDLAMVPGPQLCSPPRPPRLPRSNAADAPRSVISSIPTARSRPVSTSSSPVPSRQYLLTTQAANTSATEMHIPPSIQPDLEKVLRKPTYLGKPAGSSPPPTVILPTSSDYFSRKEATEMVRNTRRVRNSRRILMVFVIVFAVALGIAAGVISVVLQKRASSPTLKDNESANQPAQKNLLRRENTSLNLSFNGDGTFYDVGLGACGETSHNDELVCALSATQFISHTANTNDAVVCGGCLEVFGPLGSVKVKVVDKCPGCSSGDLDLSPAAFNKIAKPEDGRVKITWKPCDSVEDFTLSSDAVQAFVTAISSTILKS